MDAPENISPSLVGYTLGAYFVEEEIGTSRWGRVYRAQQSSVNRTVALKVLDPQLAYEPGRADQFMEESQVAAQNVHPNIVSVLEAGQASGYTFCAMEFMDGPPLQEYLSQPAPTDADPAATVVNEHRLLLVVQGIATGLEFLWQRTIPHQTPIEKNVLVNSVDLAKLKEIEPFDAPASESVQQDMLALGVLLAETTNRIGPVSERSGELVERMVGTSAKGVYPSFAELASDAARIDYDLFPPTRPEELRIGRIEQKKSNPLVLIGSAVAVVLLVGLLVWQWRVRIEPVPVRQRPADFGTRVLIPAGEFIFQNGITTNLPAFEIDKYEVTIGEYREFLEALAAGAEVRKHPFTPHGSKFEPAHWDKLVLAIEQQASFNGGSVTWDSPIFGVDWYSAYGYASWKGQQLPSDLEWEKAARGTDGREFPWGDTPAPGTANIGKTGKWSLVYDFPGDVSPFGVRGLGGNVNEWTRTAPSRSAAVVRGASFNDTETSTTVRHARVVRTYKGEATGFRCVREITVTADEEPATP